MKNIVTLVALLVIGFAINAQITNTTSTSAIDLPEDHHAIEWKNISLEEAQALAKETGKPLYIDISTSWCGYCKKMKRNVYTQTQVIENLNKNFIPLAIDGEKGEGVTLVRKHKVRGYPTQIIISGQGEIIGRHDGYMSESKLLNFLSKS